MPACVDTQEARLDIVVCDKRPVTRQEERAVASHQDVPDGMPIDIVDGEGVLFIVVIVLAASNKRDTACSNEIGRRYEARNGIVTVATATPAPSITGKLTSVTPGMASLSTCS